MLINEAVHDLSAALAGSRQFLLALARHAVPDDLRAKAGVSDLVQDALVAAHRARHQFAGRTLVEFRGWLRAILAHEAATLRRRFHVTAARDPRREVGPAAANVPSSDPCPVAVLIGRERDEQLAAAVARLPDDHRRVVVLRVERGLPFAAIGREMGRSEDAARNLFDRAVRRLRVTVPA